MLFPDHRIIVLDVPGAPEWWATPEPHTLREADLGQLKIAFQKSADRILHVEIEADAGTCFAKAEMPLFTPKQLPLNLFIGWDQKGVRLRLDGQQPIRRLWQQPPAPLRP